MNLILATLIFLGSLFSIYSINVEVQTGSAAGVKGGAPKDTSQCAAENSESNSLCREEKKKFEASEFRKPVKQRVPFKGGVEKQKVTVVRDDDTGDKKAGKAI